MDITPPVPAAADPDAVLEPEATEPDAVLEPQAAEPDAGFEPDAAEPDAVFDPDADATIVSVEEDEWMAVYLWNINQFIGENVRFSDTKAGSVIVLSGAVLSMLQTGGFHRSFSEHPIGEWTLGSLASLLTFLCLGAAVLAAAWSIRPRLVRNFSAGYVFWESILAHGSSQVFVQELNRRSRRELIDHLAVQLYSVSAVASAKFRWVARAMVLCMTGAVLGAIVLVAR
jgi:hypothetical protein